MLKNSGIKIFDVRQIIKQDLTTSTTSELLMGGATAPSPDQLWQNFLKLNQQAKVEAYPIHVSSFVDKVSKKPTDSQLQELYETGKSTFSHPDLPTAGFARRDQFNIEYVDSNFKAWIPREKAKINELEMKAEYDRQLAAGLLKVPVDYKAPEAAPAATAPGAATPDAAAPSVTPPATTHRPQRHHRLAQNNQLPPRRLLLLRLLLLRLNRLQLQRLRRQRQQPNRLLQLKRHPLCRTEAIESTKL